MSLLVKYINLSMFCLSITFLNEANAGCARCAEIEKEREEERATKGIQTPGYYDQDHKDKISSINQTTSVKEAIPKQIQK